MFSPTVPNNYGFLKVAHFLGGLCWKLSQQMKILKLFHYMAVLHFQPSQQSPFRTLPKEKFCPQRPQM